MGSKRNRMKLLLAALLLTNSALALPPLVFMRESDQGKHVVLLEKGKEVRLTTGDRWHLYPDISADGQWLAWVAGDSEANLALTVYHRPTQRLETWNVPMPGRVLHPKFTKQADKIFFSAPTPEGQKIMSIDLARHRKEGVTEYAVSPTAIDHEGSGFFPKPSPDGTRLTFQRNLSGKKEIIEHEISTKRSKVLVEGMSPALSFDGSRIAYTSKASGNWDVMTFDRRSQRAERITSSPADELAPSFSPAGGIAYASKANGNFSLHELTPAGATVTLTTPSGDDYAPQFAGEVEWKQDLGPSFPAPLRSSLGAIEHEGKIYLCGGHAGAEHTYPPESFTDTLQVFDVASGHWKALAPRPHKAHGFQLAAKGKYLYAFGGFAYEGSTRPKWKSLAVIDRYDIERDLWETIGELPRRRSSNVAVTVGTKVFLIGGWDATPKKPGDAEGTFHSEVDVFDLETEKVSRALWDLPLPLRRAFTAVSYEGQILLIGGLGVGASHFELLNHVTRIDPVSGAATNLPPLPFATFAPAAGVLGNQLVIFGGMFKTGPADYEYVSHVYALDLRENTWRHTGRYLSETKGFSQVVPFADGLAVIGGHRYVEDRDSPVATFEVFSR